MKYNKLFEVKDEDVINTVIETKQFWKEHYTVTTTGDRGAVYALKKEGEAINTLSVGVERSYSYYRAGHWGGKNICHDHGHYVLTEDGIRYLKTYLAEATL